MPGTIRAIALVALIGFAVGIIGGLVGGGAWFHGVELVFFVGAVVVWLYSLWKRPQGLDTLAMEDTPPEYDPPPINVASAEQELRRKDRGTEPRAR